MMFELEEPAFCTVAMQDGTEVDIDIIEAHIEIARVQEDKGVSEIIETAKWVKPWLEEKLGFTDGGLKLNQAAGLVGKILSESNPIVDGLKKKATTTAS